MKMHIFIMSCVVSLVIYNGLLTNTAPDNYQQIECTITLISNTVEGYCSHPHIPGPRSINRRIPNGQATSTNWSGYAATNNFTHPSKNSVSAVSGTWIVPTLKATPNDSSCSYWVGIDGYNSPTVEQIGTEHDWDHAHNIQSNYAWFEMYPGGSYQINGFPLHPGDVISASVVYAGNSTFVLTLINDTQKITTIIPSSYTRSTTALRQSAEWIIEAPYYQGILPLSNFVTGHMWGCLATINGVNAPIGNNSWKNVGISMVTSTGAAKGITSALLSDKGSFFVSWQHE